LQVKDRKRNTIERFLGDPGQRGVGISAGSLAPREGKGAKREGNEEAAPEGQSGCNWRRRTHCDWFTSKRNEWA
jgi:hypothetical protein